MPETLSYLSSPYTLYAKGLDAAFQEIAAITGRLRKAGLFVFSPIVHSHSEAVYAELDPLDLTLWYPYNKIMMQRCDNLIVAHMDGWNESAGVKGEIEFFEKAARPIFDLDPLTLSMVKRGHHFDERMHVGIADMPHYKGTLGPLAMPDAKGQ
jgi:hypothetical protein